MILWLGWFGFNGGSVLSADPALTSITLVNTCLAAAAGGCPDYHYIDHLDTPQYQALSAACKEEIIWNKCIADRTPERFFVGNEFKGFFNMDFNLTHPECTVGFYD